MAKSFKLQINPTFKATVNVPRVGDKPMAVPFEFKVMDRRVLGTMFDEWKKKNLALFKEAEEAAAAGTEFSLETWTERELALQVAQVKEIVVGWGFDDEFSDENIEALLVTSVGVTDAILAQYNDAYTKARQGN